MKFFNADPVAFYDSAINDNIPETAIQISNERYAELFEGQAMGKLIVADASGNPALTDPPPVDPQIAINARSRKYLNDTDWYVIRFAETGEPVPEEITAARAEARLAIKE